MAGALIIAALLVRHDRAADSAAGTSGDTAGAASASATAASAGDTLVAAAPAPSTDDASGRPQCSVMIAGLSARDRLAQRLMVGVDARAPSAAQGLAAHTHVGGVFVGGNATELLQPGALAAVRTAAPVPVAVTVDEEGGRVQRIDALAGDWPSARQMGTMPAEDVRRIAAERGRRLAALGITIDFAPIADLGGQPAGAVIGDRAFGADPETVATHAGAFAAGLRDSQVVPVFKHFPGHGRASGNSHAGLVTTPPLNSLRARDLRPYTRLLPQGNAAVMVGHLDVPGLTDGAPATLSAPAYRLLREEYGFTGVTMTDDLGAMRAVTNRYSLVDAVVLALASGADIALWTSTGQVDEVLDKLVAETEAGRLPAPSTDAAVARILTMKGLCRE